MDLLEWGRRMEDIEYKRVAETTLGDYWISTVWLGIDHNWMRQGPPIIFETMIFDRSPEVTLTEDLSLRLRMAIGMVPEEEQLPLAGSQWRYATEEQAREGHVKACELVRLELGIETVESEEEEHTNGND